MLRFRAEVDAVDSTPKSTTLPAALLAPPSVPPRRGVRVPPVLRSRLPKVAVDGRPRAARAEEEERALADRIAPPPPEESPKEAVEDVRDMPAVDIIAAGGWKAECVSAGEGTEHKMCRFFLG